jgi:hypothetical protein
VKYASRVKCAAAREGIYFISHCDQREQYFTIHGVNYFTFDNAEYFTKNLPQQVADVRNAVTE